MIPLQGSQLPQLILPRVAAHIGSSRYSNAFSFVVHNGANEAQLLSLLGICQGPSLNGCVLMIIPYPDLLLLLVSLLPLVCQVEDNVRYMEELFILVGSRWI